MSEEDENKRVSVSKKMRFDVFKRDWFTCQYCGAKPPSVVLEVDHIHPVSKGGKNRVDNLITSCFDCNRGKSNGLLDVAPQTIANKAEVLKEKMEQLKAFEKIQKQKRDDEEKSIDLVEQSFSNHFNEFSFKTKFRESVRVFLQKMTTYELIDAMDKACIKIGDPEKAIKYFCGICWNIIRSKNDEHSQ